VQPTVQEPEERESDLVRLIGRATTLVLRAGLTAGAAFLVVFVGTGLLM
jgi:hypothetical protein